MIDIEDLSLTFACLAFRFATTSMSICVTKLTDSFLQTRTYLQMITYVYAVGNLCDPSLFQLPKPQMPKMGIVNRLRSWCERGICSPLKQQAGLESQQVCGQHNVLITT